MQAEREREEEERLLELKDEEYELLDEDSLQVILQLPVRVLSSFHRLSISFPLQNIEVTTEKDSNLMSTVLVSTVYPEDSRESTFVEVATIRSPYSFTFEDGMSTRYASDRNTITMSQSNLSAN